jgi:hypothetical protein
MQDQDLQVAKVQASRIRGRRCGVAQPDDPSYVRQSSVGGQERRAIHFRSFVCELPNVSCCKERLITTLENVSKDVGRTKISAKGFRSMAPGNHVRNLFFELTTNAWCHVIAPATRGPSLTFQSSRVSCLVSCPRVIVSSEALSARGLISVRSDIVDVSWPKGAARNNLTHINTIPIPPSNDQKLQSPGFSDIFWIMGL